VRHQPTGDDPSRLAEKQTCTKPLRMSDAQQFAIMFQSSLPSSANADRLKARQPITKPVPAYLPTAGSPLKVDEGLYAAIRDAPRVLVEEFTLPIRSGRAWSAPAGSIVSISTPEGPQVGMSMAAPSVDWRSRGLWHPILYCFAA
jgi:hypothetical protein